MQKTLLCALVLISLSLISGCSSTRVVASWHDDSYSGGNFGKPVILSTAKQQIIRAKLEDELVRGLRTIGVEGVQSYRLFPEPATLNPEMVKNLLPGTDRNAILVVHLVNIDKETVVVPGRTDIYPTGGAYAMPAYYNRFGTYYAQSYSVVSSPGYSYESNIYKVETNLYAADTEKLIWSVITETEDPDTIDSGLKELVREIVKDLQKNRVF